MRGITDDDLFAVGRVVAVHSARVGLPPTLEEIAAAIGLKSKAGAHARVWGAVDAGYLTAIARGAGHRFVVSPKTLERMG